MSENRYRCVCGKYFLYQSPGKMYLPGGKETHSDTICNLVAPPPKAGGNT